MLLDITYKSMALSILAKQGNVSSKKHICAISFNPSIFGLQVEFFFDLLS